MQSVVSKEPHARFTSLMGLLFDPEGLRESFGRQDGRKAPGVDGIRKYDYAQGVEERLEDLSARIRRLGYLPTPVRRTYIPKGDGRYRPLGVPSFEDRLVQDRLRACEKIDFPRKICKKWHLAKEQEKGSASSARSDRWGQRYFQLGDYRRSWHLQFSLGAYWPSMPLGHGAVRLCALLQTQGNPSHQVMGKGVP